MRLAKEALILFLVCIFVVSAANETDNRTIKGKVQATTISICEGCIIGTSCVEVGGQKRESLNSPLYYCGPDNKGLPAKDVGEICSANYECVSYTCNKGYCDAKLGGKNTSTILIVVFIGLVIVLGGLGVLFLKLGKGIKILSKEEKKMEKEQKKPAWQESVKGIRPGTYRYKPEYDILEKKLKERLKFKK